MVGSDAQHSDKDGIVQPPPHKRRRVSTMSVATGRTASQQQSRPYCSNSSSREARRSSQRLKRSSERGAAYPPSRESRYRGMGDRDAVFSAKRHRPAQGSNGSVKGEDKPTSTLRRANTRQRATGRSIG